jgi:predicted nucleotidyltransferase
MGQGEALVRARMPELTTLCRRFGVRRLELFGSALRADFDPATSDLDFLFEIEPPAGLGYADAYFGLREGLEQLFGRAVDLVSIGAVKNPHLLQAIERSRRLLYAA